MNPEADSSMQIPEPPLVARRVVPSRFLEGRVANALWFQATWCCAVLGREGLLPLTLALLALHLAWVRDTRQELLQLSSVAAVGIGVDAALSAGGFYIFSSGALVPLWLCCVWLAFATTMGRGLAYLGDRPLLAALAGALAMPFNYWAGHELGAVSFGYPTAVTLPVVALVWAIGLPCLFRLNSALAAAGQVRKPEPQRRTS